MRFWHVVDENERLTVSVRGVRADLANASANFRE